MSRKQQVHVWVTRQATYYPGKDTSHRCPGKNDVCINS